MRQYDEKISNDTDDSESDETNADGWLFLLQTKLELAEKESNRTHQRLKQESERIRVLEIESKQLMNRCMDLEYQLAIERRTNRKPDVVDRISSLPQPILEGIATILGRVSKSNPSQDAKGI